MTNYFARSGNTLSFEVTEEERLVGTLTYKSWFQFSAEINLADHRTYRVEPKGFWGTTIELLEGSQVLLHFKMNWNGTIVIQTQFNGIAQDFVLKQKGIFKGTFILADHEGTELLAMKPDLKWNTMKYEYEIAAADAFDTLPGKEILLMSSIHCANYFMAMMMTGVAPGAWS